ncbi:hypothetical protein [Kitasatospora sp. MBT63]|uniref:hypothetical protein n=1 Tax=Kitasatospora sp. MBT63 TaxID=1444768 RepID=UPI000AD048AF|nr:hypothetical protein [Kitasatospora sp. MBT63]
MSAIPKDEVLPLPDRRTRQARALWALVTGEAFERRARATEMRPTLSSEDTGRFRPAVP